MADFLAAERARKVVVADSTGGGISAEAMSRIDLDAVVESGRDLSAKYWVTADAWPGASWISWSSDDEKEDMLARSYETVPLSGDGAEVRVKTSHLGTLLRHEAYKLVRLGDGWRIAECFELSTDTDEHNGIRTKVSLHVSGVHTAPRWVPAGGVPRWVQDRLTPAWRLHALRDDFVTAADSHTGGPFAGADRGIWPGCDAHQTPLVGVLQLWKRDIPRAIVPDTGDLFSGTEFRLRDWEEVFPNGADLLQVFWCPFDHLDQSDVVLRWEDASRLSLTIEKNPEHRRSCWDGRVPKPCRLFGDYVLDRPSLREAESSDAWSEILADHFLQSVAGIVIDDCPIPACNLSSQQTQQLADTYWEWFGAAPGTKLRGYPDWIQDEEIPVCGCGAAMSHLLTIASSGNPTEGPWRASVSPPEAEVDWDGGLCLGDVGNVYVFACPSCPDMKSVKSVFQCS